MTRLALALIWLAANACPAMAQEASPSFELSRPTVGGTIRNPVTAPPSFAAKSGNEILRHRDFTGKPCLAVSGYARPHTVNHNLYDHVITAVNSCPQRISMRVCYYQTQDCISMEIPGGERKEATLGTLPSAKDFGFEFREKF